MLHVHNSLQGVYNSQAPLQGRTRSVTVEFSGSRSCNMALAAEAAGKIKSCLERAAHGSLAQSMQERMDYMLSTGLAWRQRLQCECIGTLNCA